MDISTLNPRILKTTTIADLPSAMEEINVDPRGISLMSPKGEILAIKLHQLKSKWCNILKQELLSVGGDVAVSKDMLYHGTSPSDCIIIATLKQIGNLLKKLTDQPSSIRKIGNIIDKTVENYRKENYTLKLPDGKIQLNNYDPLIMGVLNLTPDSFSKDGVYKEDLEIDEIVKKALEIEKAGADIIDIGGESTRPGSEKIAVDKEIKRVIPVLKAIKEEIHIPISIDTYKSEVAQRALQAGASILNDISGLTADRNMPPLLSHYKPAVVLMHKQGAPKDMQKDPSYHDIMKQITAFLRKSTGIALKAGLKKENIIIDPGIGFGKTTAHNLFLIQNLQEFKTLGYPILIGTSRKSFIGNITGKDVSGRLMGTAASVALAISNGANIVRVHDIEEMKEVCDISKSILTQTPDRL